MTLREWALVGWRQIRLKFSPQTADDSSVRVYRFATSTLPPLQYIGGIKSEDDRESIPGVGPFPSPSGIFLIASGTAELRVASPTPGMAQRLFSISAAETGNRVVPSGSPTPKISRRCQRSNCQPAERAKDCGPPRKRWVRVAI